MLGLVQKRQLTADGNNFLEKAPTALMSSASVLFSVGDSASWRRQDKS